MAEGATIRMATGIAGLFAAGTEEARRALDAGAEASSLSDAFLRRWLLGEAVNRWVDGVGRKTAL